MFLALFSTLLSSLSDVFRKRSLVLNTFVSSYGFKFLGLFFWPFLLALFFIISGKFSFSLWKNIFFLILMVTFLCLFTTLISQEIYKVEKFSTLLPFENINKVLIIIISFFIFADISLLSMSISFFILCLIIATSIDFKSLSLPKNIQLLFLHQAITTVKILLLGYILKQVVFIQYYTVYTLIFFWLLVFGVFYKKDHFALFWGTKNFYFNRLWAATIWGISEVIDIYIVANFWVIFAILVSFLDVVVRLISSFLFLAETPTKKDIIMAFLITFLVGVWVYFK